MTNKHLFSRLLKKAILMALWTKASLCVKSSLLKQSLPRTQSRLTTLCPLWLFSLCLCVFVAINPFNQRNLRLINDLRLFKALYNCRETFTDVMSPLQIRLFMQNEPNFPDDQMNVNKALTGNYENKTLGERGKKQSQTKPNKANSKKAKMNVTSYITKGYENKPPIMAPKKQTQISKRQKPMQTSLPQRIMKTKPPSGSKNTNPTCRGVASGEAGLNPMLVRHQCGGSKAKK